MTGDKKSAPAIVSCPAPIRSDDRILLAHGEGARLSRKLIQNMIRPILDNPFLRPLADAAVLPAINKPIAFSADGFVVDPLFFPGGDIGKLAVYGTVNDLAVQGARPMFLSLGMIIEEGLSFETLRRVLESVRMAAERCGVHVVAGDTKVVPRGKADKVYLHTTGVGRLETPVRLSADRVEPGDKVIVSGTIGEHGLAVLAARENLDFGEQVISDCAPVHELTAALFDAGEGLRFMRDPTRGGLAAVLHEVVEARQLSILIDETSIPVLPAVRGACELLGLDPLYVANEGKILLITSSNAANDILLKLREFPMAQRAAIIGEIAPPDGRPEAMVRGVLGRLRSIDEPSGSPLPRIC